MSNNVNIRVNVDARDLELLSQKAQQSAKIIRGGFDIATGAAAAFGEKSREAFEKLANQSIIVANTFNGIEDLIEGLGKSQGFLNVAQKVGIGQKAIQGFANSLPVIGTIAAIAIPIVTSLFDTAEEGAKDTKKATDELAEAEKRLKTEIENVGKAYDFQIQLAQARGRDTLELEKKASLDQLAEVRRRLNQRYQVLEKGAIDERTGFLFQTLLDEKLAQDKAYQDLLSLQTKYSQEVDIINAKLGVKQAAAAKKAADDVEQEIIRKQAAIRAQDISLLNTLIFGEDTLDEPLLSEEDKRKLSNAISLALLGVTEQTRNDIKEAPAPSSLLDLITPTETEVTEWDATLSETLNIAGERIDGFLQRPEFKQSLEAFNNLGNSIIDFYDTKLEALSKAAEQGQKIVDERETKALEAASDNNEDRLRIERKYQAERIKLEEETALKEKEIRKKQADIQLAITIANTIAAGAQAVASALDLPPPFNFILAGIVGASVGVQIATAVKQRNEVAQLARGGVLKGPSHSQGGIYMGGGVEAEGGEAVINKRSTSMFGPLLSRINEAGGGVPLFPTKMAQGGVLGGNGQQSLDDLTITKLASAIAASPVRAYVVTNDITTSQNKQAVIQRRAVIV